MVLFAILAMFVAGLMVGRTPEYLGKKIEASEMKIAMLAVLILPLVMLGFSAVSVVLPSALESLDNAGPHGLSEILYAFASAAANNGSAFAGLNRHTPWFNTTLGIAMLLGRFAVIVPVMAIGGSLAAKQKCAVLGHVPDRRAAVRRPADGRDPDPRRPAIFPGAGARADRRAFPDARRQDVLTFRSNPCRKRYHAAALDRPLIVARDRGCVPQARSALTRPESRHVRHRDRSSAVVTVLFVRDLASGQAALFSGQLAFWLWFTVLFANFAEAVAEGRGKAQADTCAAPAPKRAPSGSSTPSSATAIEGVTALDLRPGDVVLVEAGDVIPGDGEMVEGVASVNEAAVTGESAPVIREAGGDRSAVTGGTTVLSDWIMVRITSAPGSSFLDRMIALVEGAERQKTPNEIALSVLLAGLTLIFLIAVVTLTGSPPIPARRVGAGAGRAARHADPDDHRRAAVGHRHRRHGPALQVQRDRHVGPRRRGGG